MIGPYKAYHQDDFIMPSALSCELDFTPLPQNHRDRSVFDNHRGGGVADQRADPVPQVAAISTVNIYGRAFLFC